jgi:hypothetical protein
VERPANDRIVLPISVGYGGPTVTLRAYDALGAQLSCMVVPDGQALADAC